MDYERETLVAYLREYGITYLAPSDAVATETITSESELIRGLLASGDERLQMAMVPLFMSAPHLSISVPILVTELPPDQAIDLKTYYMAAVYLHRIWQFRLGFYMDNTKLLPDYFSAELGLPLPEENFGTFGLHDLVDDWQRRSVFPFNYMSSLNTTMDLFFAELWMSSKTPRPIAPYIDTPNNPRVI